MFALALEQAGAYIETSGCTMPHYLDLFEQRQRELLQRGELSTEYPDTVATTWSISFQNVEREIRQPPSCCGCAPSSRRMTFRSR